MRLYLAGPMRGIPMFNFPAFIAAAMALRDDGHFVDNPAERDLAEGFNPDLPLDHPDNARTFNIATAFKWDFEAIVKAEAIVLLPGWQESKGVQSELVLAHTLTRPVYEWYGGALIPLDIESYTVTFKLANVLEPAE